MKQLFKLLHSASLDYKISENDIMRMIISVAKDDDFDQEWPLTSEDDADEK